MKKLFRESKRICILVFLVAISSNCSRGLGSSNEMAFGKVRYVQEFPMTQNLQGVCVDEIVLHGATNFLIRDSLMIVSSQKTDGFWTVFNLNTLSESVKLFRQGNGPDELLICPELSESYWTLRDGGVYVKFRNYQRLGSIVEVSLSEAMQTGNPKLRTVLDSIPHTMFVAIPIGDSLVLGREVNVSHSRQDRFLIGPDGKKEYPSYLDDLNRASVSLESDVNILSAVVQYNSKHDRVVEAPIFLNTLNVYSIDGSFTRSICFGRKSVRIEEVEGKQQGERRRCFASLRQFEKGFGVLWLDVPLFGEHGNKSSVLFFDWDGNPLCKLNMDHYATAFDIDMRTGTLYLFNSDDETLWRYDISAIAAELQ